MFKWKVGDKGGFAEVTFIEHSARFHLTPSKEFTATLVDLFCVILGIIVVILIDHGPQIGGAIRGVTHDQLAGRVFQTAQQIMVNCLIDDLAGGGGTLLCLSTKS